MEEAGLWHRPLLNYLLLCNVTGVRQAQVSQGLVDDFGWQRDVTILHHHLLARLRQAPKSLEKPIDSPPTALWDKWPIMVLFIVLLCGEWALRKKWGLV